ncbi:Spindle and kinetochore-associated protein 1 [Frankliniella fusca]|uniref:SKA complex subunit 1 n=1 Tax=Frankliniella fusca TaxID=407009 RepID=A0AAE1LTT5_9NEOP|nr:Spindle and kinetochore-associated protein 1 [Frankliniella fusca]
MADMNMESFVVESDESEVPSALFLLLDRVTNLKLIVSSFQGWDEEVAASKSSTVKSLVKLKHNFEELRSIFQAILDNVKDLRYEECFARYLRQKSEYVQNNIPDKYNCGSGVIKVSAKTGKTDKLTVTSSIEADCKEQSSTEKEAIRNSPEVFFLTVDEFENIPKYLKGRITYEKVNAFIELFNKVLSRKYAIFKRKKSALKKKEADLWNEYNKQELKETKGLYFCVADDFKNLNGCALDKSGLSILTILRHCKRIRELRTGGILRYVAMF